MTDWVLVERIYYDSYMAELWYNNLTGEYDEVNVSPGPYWYSS